jgi:iron complex transport system ATP-binding protein
MIAFENLSLSLRGRSILNQMSGRIDRGRVTVILGPNGAGKSTLLSCLAGLRVPDAGSLTLDGASIANMNGRERGRRIGLLPQKGDIHWDLSVAALVSLGRLPHHDRWQFSQADEGAVTAAMTMTDVVQLAERPVLSLSGGEQARVLLARVFAGQPEWLLADEPLANLDPLHQLDTLDRLSAYAKGVAGVVIVMHDLTLAARIADDVIILKNGTVEASGPQSQVMTPSILSAAFGIEVDIVKDRTGGSVITLLGAAG